MARSQAAAARLLLTAAARGSVSPPPLLPLFPRGLPARTPVASPAELPAERLAAGIENCLLECTNTRLPRALEQPAGLGAARVNQGAAGLIQHLMPAAGVGGDAVGGGASSPLDLLPTPPGCRLADLLARAVLPPSAARGLLAPPAAALFKAHSAISGGRKAAAESFELGSMPAVHERTWSHVRTAARRGSTLFTLLTGGPLWQRWETAPEGATAAPGTSGERAGKQAAGRKRKQAGGGSGGSGGAGGGRAPLGPCTLLESACSCCHPDLGALWCQHRCDALEALSSDPALHVLDCDALAALLAPLAQRQLAQLLLAGAACRRGAGGRKSGGAVGSCGDRYPASAG